VPRLPILARTPAEVEPSLKVRQGQDHVRLGRSRRDGQGIGVACAADSEVLCAVRVGAGDRATRNPYRASRVRVPSWLRLAEASRAGASFHDPPRRTRSRQLALSQTDASDGALL
jgi:hypothetical protein